MASFLKFIKIILKAIFLGINGILGIGMLIYVTFGIGWYIGTNIIKSTNPFGIMLSHVFLCLMNGYLIIRAEITGNDGMGPVGMAEMISPFIAGITTIVIFKIVSVGTLFTILNVLIFLWCVTVGAWLTDKSASKVIKRRMSVYLADKTGDIIWFSVLLTALSAFLLFHLLGF